MKRNAESGVALLSVILVMMLMSALLVGFVALVVTDQQSSGVNRDQTQAYAAAHAGLEKLTADLAQLFTGGNFSPSAAQIAALAADPPDLAGFIYEGPGGTPGYVINSGAVQTAPIAAGPYQGLVGLITPYDITVTARTDGGSEVRMRRQMQTIAVPVFQFGIYSENDLSFFAGPNFNFGGRVHSNQNIYLNQDGTNTLTLEDRVTAVGEVVRTHLANGAAAGVSGVGYTGTVRMARAPGVYRNLALTEGSCTIGGNPPAVPPSILVPGPPPEMVMQANVSENEPTWTNLSVGTYNGYVRNGRTGARRLELPLVSNGAVPIDIIRRPNPASPDPQEVLRQRFFWMASLRILISDRPEDITSLPTVTPGAPVNLADLAASGYAVDGTAGRVNVARSWGSVAGQAPDNVEQGGYRTPLDTPLVDGYIKIERQDVGGTWHDVTMEILNLGFAGRNLSNGTLNQVATSANNCLGAEPSPNAIIRFQRLRDDVDKPMFDNGTWGMNLDRCGRVNATAGNFTTNPYAYWPNVLYDAREGLRRDAEATNQNEAYLGGIMHYVEFDVNNFRRWLVGDIGATGANATMNVTGFVVYFSDRRGNRNFGPDGVPGTLDDLETAEFGWEDFINPESSTSAPNGVLDTGEDMNGNGVLDTYGGTPRLTAAGWLTPPATAANGAGALDNGVNLSGSRVSWHVARMNRPVFFRRALKLVNGRLGQLPGNGAQGMTVASENPVYIEGNFNACTATAPTPGTPSPACDGGVIFDNQPGVAGRHVSAAVIADAVTLLSNNWNDIRSFASPHNPVNRPAATTHYRLGVISGKGLNFRRPTTNAGDHQDFGTDGGAHNFLRYIEGWGGQALNYRGSIVSFYISRQAVGTYKCCDNVYAPPGRGYRFDDEFLNPNLLPPRTPMFRDVNTLTFRQLLRPTQ
ncbi:MAG: hypothetical protein KJ066_12565 [Acidobacteria bacterium]|nr:hypothetical protein [Acidobacteriota bacterium]